MVVHRCLWTTFTLIITTFFFSKWNIFFTIIKSKKNLLYLFFSGFLIFINWAIWIYAIATNRIIDASFGYFIMPIISVLLGYIFFKQTLAWQAILGLFLISVNFSLKKFLRFLVELQNFHHFTLFIVMKKLFLEIVVEDFMLIIMVKI